MADHSVLVVAEDVRELAGGVPAVVRSLVENCASQSLPMRLVYATGEYAPISEYATAVGCPPTTVWQYSARLRRELHTSIGRSTITHLHGVWQAPQYLGARKSIGAGAPFILTPHGMLDDWLWKSQGSLRRIKKVLYWRLVRRIFAKADVLHALTAHEASTLASTFPGSRVEVLPNAVEIPNQPVFTSPEQRILFLGRLEPKKGVHLLVQAFANAQLPEPWTLDIVGPSWSVAYEKEIQATVRASSLERRVRLLGPKFGREKEELLRRSWAMVSPSFSEGQSLVNLEAAAQGLPAVVTPAAGYDEWNTSGGMLVSADVRELTSTLQRLAKWGLEERMNRGLAAHKYVSERYSWDVIRTRWEALYRDVAKGAKWAS